MRSDAKRNRISLLRAAKELFARDTHVSMHEIARRAGLGTATVYRHFPHRSDIAAAIADELLDDLDHLAARKRGHPDAFVTLLAAIFDTSTSSALLVNAFRESADSEADLARLRQRVLTLFSGPLDYAKAAGTVQPDLTPEDVMLLLAMIQGAVDETGEPSRTRHEAAHRAARLLLQGVMAAPASPR